jgi:transposase
MNAYSEDLRKKIVEAVERGVPKIEAARTFGVGISSVKRYVATARQGRSLAPKRRPGSKPKLDEGARRLLESDLQERPTATLPQRREFLRRIGGVEVSDSTVSRVLKRLGWTRKKDRWVASERDEFLRAAWRLMVAGEIHAERLVFVDECSTNTSLAPLCAWSRRGERAFCSLPRNWGANVTLLASMSVGGMGPCLAVEG